MRTREADAISYAIGARLCGAPSTDVDLDADDADALAYRFGVLAENLSPAEAMGEALAVGIAAGRLLAAEQAAHLPSSRPTT